MKFRCFDGFSIAYFFTILIFLVKANEVLNDGRLDDSSKQSVESGHAKVSCCANPSSIRVAQIVIVSTMDGKFFGLDAERGDLLWKIDPEASPLLSGTLSRMQPFQVEGDLYTFIPALDGSLYMYSSSDRLLEPVPLSTEDLLQASVRIGQDAVSGGKVVSTTGIDPLTGQVRYHCTSSQCATSKVDSVSSTLVLRRITNTIRAVDALTGIPRWNLSVAEYDASLISTELFTEAPPKIKLLLRPPDGIISAYDSCGQKLWTSEIGEHIAKSWLLQNGKLIPVSLFDYKNIFTLAIGGDLVNQGSEPESLFYLGTYNNEAFIMHSDKAKANMLTVSTKTADSSSLQLAKLGYHIGGNTLDDILAKAFKQSFTAQKSKDSKRNKDLVKRSESSLQVVSREGSSKACPNIDSTSLIGESNIKSVGISIQDDLIHDRGWLIISPTQSSIKRSLLSGLKFPSQCAADFIDGVPALDWKYIFAFGLAFFMTGMLIPAIVRRLFDEKEASSPLSRGSHVENVETYVAVTDANVQVSNNGFRTHADPYDHPNPLLVSDERLKHSSSTETRSSVGSSSEFQSKFVAEFTPEKILGRGGFGLVFRAKNKLDQHTYAVKRVSVAKNPNAIDKVLREVVAMADLEHPSIIRYFGSWIEDPPKGWQEQMDQSFRKLSPKTGRKRNHVDSTCSKRDLDHSTNETESASDQLAPKTPSITDDGSWAAEHSAHPQEINTATTTESSNSGSGFTGKFWQGGYGDQESSSGIIFRKSTANNLSLATESLQLKDLVPGLALDTSRSKGKDVVPASGKDVVYLYIQMQLCRGGTMHDWLLKHPLKTDRPLLQMKSWFAQICLAVEYLHENGLIHRDLKPQNIFFASHDVIKVGDLGLVTRSISSMVDERETLNDVNDRYTNNVGTRVYMSPEQLANNAYTEKVDVFSMGLIYMELIVAFSTQMERIQTFCQLQVGSVPDILDALDPAERKIILSMTDFDAEKRPSCADLIVKDYFDDVQDTVNPQLSFSVRRRRFSEARA